MKDNGQTRTVTFARHADAALEGRVHCLEIIEGQQPGHCFIVPARGATIGRMPPADMVLADSEVSRSHCRLVLENDILIVTDLGSTNGTFIDGVRISIPTQLAIGAVLQVGLYMFQYRLA